MFFTNEVSIALNTLKDVIRAYPSWRLVVNSGNSMTVKLIRQISMYLSHSFTILGTHNDSNVQYAV